MAKFIDEVDVYNPEIISRCIKDSSSYDVNIYFFRTDIIGQIKGYNILWAIFESTKVPDSLLSILKSKADLIWVPSKWGRDVLLQHGLSSEIVDVVPEGVDIWQYHPYRRSLVVNDRPFRFLTVGKFEGRKSYEELLEAFAMTCRNNKDVELVIKADYFLRHEEKKQEFSTLLSHYACNNIRVYWGAWSNEMMFDLYNWCHAFVFPSKGEGWGLPLIEAAACGLPLITTYYSGQTEYLSHIRSSIVELEHQMGPIDDNDYAGYYHDVDEDYGHWALPNIHKLAEAMMSVKDLYAEYAKKSIEASEIIRIKYSWDNAVVFAMKSLLSNNLLNE